jgi:ABC-type antimicrobial peptide transport system permease subunit
MYLPWPTAFSSEVTLHMRTLVNPTTIIPVLRREVEAEAADLPLFQVETMEDHLAFALLPARLVAVAVGIFGALCLVLLGVGIHGIVAYSVSRRTREVGIRVAIGAQPRSATRLVLREESRIIISGLIIGLAGALAAGPVVERVLYSGEGLDPAVMVGAPLFLLLVAGVAAYFPARKAALVDPCQALRGE